MMVRNRLATITCSVGIWTAVVCGGRGTAPAAERGSEPQVAEQVDLQQVFRSPPQSCRPWVYWWWLNANVTEQSITRDLEAMAAQGVGGFLLFDVTAYGHHIVAAPPRQIEFMSPQWRERVRFALREAHRLGLQASINLSTCGGALRAPWDMEQHAVKQLLWSSTEVQGPIAVNQVQPASDAPYFRPVALVAARVGNASGSPNVGAAGPWSPVRDSVPENAETATQVLDLTAAVDDNGQLNWNAPPGRWLVVRLACGVMADRREDVDILNVEAVESHFERMGRALIADAGPLAGSTLTHFYNVSWEGETPSWTPGFERDFLRFRGYDLAPYLPALAGINVRDPDTTQRFRRDYARTIADCFMTNCYGRFDELCREAGLKWHSESGGPWDHRPLLFRAADQLAFWGRNAMPQSEFWVPDYRSNVRRAAMAAHIYGKPLTSVEAFTHMTYHWSQYPAALKGPADMALCDGANQFVWHTSSASPDEFGLPGIVYFAGTHVNRHVTWYPYVGGFMDYLGRCQTMLRQGRYVADVCVYTSDRNCAVWTRARQWSKEASLQLPPGYAYDLLDTEVLTERLRVDANGDLVLPDGMRYRLLVLDPEEDVLPAEAVRKVVQLVEAGGTVVLGKRIPTTAPGLHRHPHATAELAIMAARLWQTPEPICQLGQGTVIRDTPLGAALQARNILPDCTGTADYIHRRVGDADIYFVAGQGRVDLSFRATGKEPEVWDPVTGQITRVARYVKSTDGRVTIPWTLPAQGSLLVVFRAPEQAVQIASANGPARVTLESREGSAVPIQFWKNGKYTFRNSQAQQIDVDIQDLCESLALDENWEVRFPPGWGAPESIQFARLIPWNAHEQPDIKYFSGTATYRKQIELSDQQAAGLLRLDLGQVGCIARVRCNDQDLGVVWTAPWTVDLTGQARPGKNTLQIDVANVWQNRLIGDAGLPEDQRRTRTNVVLEKGERTRRYRCSSVNSIDALTPSGLLGPVRLEFGRRTSVQID